MEFKSPITLQAIVDHIKGLKFPILSRICQMSLLETNRPQAQIHALHGQARDINLSIPIKIQARMPIVCKRYNDLRSIKSLHGIHCTIVSPFKIIVLCLVMWNESQLSVSHFHPHQPNCLLKLRICSETIPGLKLVNSVLFIPFTFRFGECHCMDMGEGYVSIDKTRCLRLKDALP